MAPSRKKCVQKEHRTRSTSPASQPQPLRIREKLPNRENRRSSTLSSHDYRMPIDCPLPSCNATTVRQHHDDLQFFNPHPANEFPPRGYASSHRVASSQPNVANGGPAVRSQETFRPEIRVTRRQPKSGMQMGKNLGQAMMSKKSQ